MEFYIVELATRTGTVCEKYATYEEARRRVDQFPAESLVGLPLIFKELPDGSQRLVREDGKPLQWHRLPEDAPPGPAEPIPVAEEVPEGARVIEALHPSRRDPDEPQPPG
jgi:hypothetical protein